MPAPDDHRPRPEALAAVATTFVDVMRSFTREKARMPHHDVEFASHFLLRLLGVEGASRISSLAEWAGYDVSTVSRQVAALEKDGLVERTADDADRRASLVVPTAAGRAVIAGYEQNRLAFFDHVLADWTTDEIDAFASHLQHFADSYESAGRDWIAARRARRSASPLDSTAPLEGTAS